MVVIIVTVSVRGGQRQVYDIVHCTKQRVKRAWVDDTK